MKKIFLKKNNPPLNIIQLNSELLSQFKLQSISKHLGVAPF